MKRHFNYTNRKRVPRENVEIVLKNHGSGPLLFDARVDLKEMQLPESGRVFIEAYYRNSYMRFDFGTVANIQCDEDRTLRDIDNRENIQFRVKIVDTTSEHGKLLAEADRLVALPAEGPADKVGILAVRMGDLGSQAWNIDLTDTNMPTLVVNQEIGSKEYIRSSETFFALVFPAVVREVLTCTILVDAESGYEPDPESEDWQERWLHFVSQIPGVGMLPRQDADVVDKVEWIDQAVRAFCDNNRACRSFLELRKKEEAA